MKNELTKTKKHVAMQNYIRRYLSFLCVRNGTSTSFKKLAHIPFENNVSHFFDRMGYLHVIFIASRTQMITSRTQMITIKTQK